MNNAGWEDKKIECFGNNKTDAPEQMMDDLLELCTKAGRRCAYDLQHACGDMRDSEYARMLRKRADMWLQIFNPANGMKDYRARLHNDIFNLEMRVERLQAILKEHNLSDPEEIPF